MYRTLGSAAVHSPIISPNELPCYWRLLLKNVIKNGILSINRKTRMTVKLRRTINAKENWTLLL